MSSEKWFGLAPRILSRSLRWQLLCGGSAGVGGWLLVAVGTVLFWGAFVRIDYTGWLEFSQPLARVSGTVTRCWKTHNGEGTKAHIHYYYGLDYRYPMPQGERRGTSYTFLSSCLPPGRQVRVEYLVSDSDTSRIVDARRSPVPPWTLCSLIFPCAGIVMAWQAYRQGQRAIRLLEHGKVAQGQLKSREKTGAKVNGAPVERLLFSFTTEEGVVAEASVETSQTKPLLDEANETLVYDPADPDGAVLIDALPAGIRRDRDGTLNGEGSRALAIAVGVPVATLVVNVIYVLVRYVDVLR